MKSIKKKEILRDKFRNKKEINSLLRIQKEIKK